MKSNQIVICVIFCLVFFAMAMPADDRQKMLNVEYEKALKAGDLETVIRTVDAGAEVSPIVELLLAVKLNYSDIVQYWISRGANINNSIVSGQTPLNNAVSSNNYEMVQLLLKLGANVTPDVIGLAIKEKDHLILKLLLQNCSYISDLFISSSSLKFFLPKEKISPVMVAVEQEDPVAVKMLIDAGVDINHKVGKYHRSALNLAYYRINIKIAQLLLAYNADTTCESLQKDPEKFLKYQDWLKQAGTTMPRNLKQLIDEILNENFLKLVQICTEDRNYLQEYNLSNIRNKRKICNEVKFLLEEGASIPDGLSIEQVKALDSVIQIINQSRIINNNLYDAIIYPGISTGMQKPVEELMYKLLSDPVASEVYQQREMMIENFSKAILNNDVNSVKRILDQGLTQNQVATLEIKPKKSLIKYVIENELENIMYELLRHDFTVKNDKSLFSEYKPRRDVEKKWVNNIIKRVNDEAKTASFNKNNSK